MQRVRVGLTGLACVFLLVMLATAFLGSGRDTSVGNTTGAAASPASAPNEPLAQLGVAPGNPAPAGAATTPAPNSPAR